MILLFFMVGFFWVLHVIICENWKYNVLCTKLITLYVMVENNHILKKFTISVDITHLKQGMPSAMPKILASFIMHENLDPIFLRREVS